MIRLGGHGLPARAEGDPAEFARAHRAFGYRAAYCPPAAVGDAARLAEIEAAFAAEEDWPLRPVGIPSRDTDSKFLSPQVLARGRQKNTRGGTCEC